MSEHLEQVRFVSWLRKNYPEHKVFAIPNGGKRGKMEAGRLKAEGVLAGVHDLHIPSLKLWIEMKKDSKGRVSKEQREWGAYVESIGQHWFVGNGFDDAKNKFKSFLKEGLEK
jgi:hypothetical protein